MQMCGWLWLGNASGTEIVERQAHGCRRTGMGKGWHALVTTPVVNYGWEINVMNHLRLTTAYEDLETAKLVDALL